jgi:hypothetical protein
MAVRRALAESPYKPVDKPRLSQHVPDIHRNGNGPTKFRHPEIVEPFLVVAKPVLLKLGINGQTREKFADAGRSGLLRGVSKTDAGAVENNDVF